MTADGFLQQKQRHPLAMTAAVAINVAAVTAVMLAKSGYIVVDHGTIQTYPVPMPSPPPQNVDPPKPRERAPVDHPVFRPKPIAESNTDKGPDIATTRDPGEILTHYPPLDDGPRIEPKQPDPPQPVTVGAEQDPRYLAAFQPPYPPQLLHTGVEGKVVVKVLIGVDGRVKQVVIVSADDEKFADATERQALSRWRFRAATRDGVPVESWKMMTVRFEIRS